MDEKIIFYVGYILGQMSRSDTLTPIDEMLKEHLLDYVRNKGYLMPFQIQEGEEK